MYEFFDAHGERVTVRSTRTLERLLGEGQITAATRFRRSEEVAFGPAAQDPELRAIADRLGIQFGPSCDPEAPPVPGALAVEPSSGAPAVAEPVLPASAAKARRPVASAAGRAAPRAEASVVVPATSPWPPAPSSPVPAAPVARLLLGTLAKGGGAAVEGAPRRIGIGILHHAAAGLAGLVTGSMLVSLTGSGALFWLGLVLGSGVAGFLAARPLASLRPPIGDWEVGSASFLFGMGCLALAGGSGVLVAVSACMGLWAARRRQEHGRKA